MESYLFCLNGHDLIKGLTTGFDELLTGNNSVTKHSATCVRLETLLYDLVTIIHAEYGRHGGLEQNIHQTIKTFNVPKHPSNNHNLY